MKLEDNRFHAFRITEKADGMITGGKVFFPLRTTEGHGTGIAQDKRIEMHAVIMILVYLPTYMMFVQHDIRIIQVVFAEDHKRVIVHV